MDIILIAGLWLPRTVWDAAAAALAHRGHRVASVRLPGVDDDAAHVTLDDQLEAVLAEVDDAERPLVVGHSAASTLAWLAADRRSASVGGVALVGGMPSTAGEQYAAFFPLEDGVMPFPGWEPFAGPDSDDLSPQQRDELANLARPVPGGVAEAVVSYTDPSRADVPVTMICPEYSPADAEAWIADGAIPELSAATALSLVDLDSGHWPMVSAPNALADAIDAVARALPRRD